MAAALPPMCGAPGVARAHCDVLTAARFAKEYSKVDGIGERVPVVIAGLMEGWAAMTRWQFDALRKDRGGDVVQVGEDPSTAEERTLPLCEMLAHVAAGDTSLYVFEAKLEERLPGLLDDFAVPRGYFDDDVLSVFVDLDPTSPPPPPPPVSSLPLHTPSPGSVATAPGRDTSAAPGAEAGLTPGPPTSAAAATAAAASNVDYGGHRGEGAPAAIDGVVSLGSEVLGSGSEKEGGEGGGGDEDDEDAGHGDEEDYGPPDRKWFLLGCRGSGSEVHQDPPHMSSWNACAVGCKRWAFVHPGCAPDATIRGVKDGAPSLAASDWFEHVLPGLAAAHPGSVHEFLQPAGTLVYFPPAVWHAVLNIEDSVAITESYVARRDYDAVLALARSRADAGTPAGIPAGTPTGIGVTARRDLEDRLAAQVDAEFGFESIARTRLWIREMSIR